MELNVGVVGLGYWGPNVLRNFAQLDNVSVTSACDLRRVSREKVKSSYPAVATTEDYDVLLKDDELAAIAVATPVSSHYELALKALEAGKHVLVEKPMTATTAEADELVRAARERNLVLMVDHTFVYTAAVRRVRAMLDAGEIGNLFYFDSQRMNLGLLQEDVNVIWDLAPHDFSILEYLIDQKPVAVSAAGGGFVGKPELAEVAYITIEYADGFFAHVAVSWLSPVKIRQIILCGSRKMVLYNDVDPTEKVRVYDKGVDVDWDEVTPFRPVYRSGDVTIPALDMSEALRVETQHFVECIAGDAEPITDGKNGRNVVALLEAASAALETGERVELRCGVPAGGTA